MAINLPLAAIPARLNPTSNQDAGSGSPIGAVTGALASMLMNSNPLLMERDDPLSKDRTMRCQLKSVAEGESSKRSTSMRLRASLLKNEPGARYSIAMLVSALGRRF